MKGLEWGRFYKEFSGKSYNPKQLEAEVSALMADKEVQKRSGIYEFLLSGRMRGEKLNLRTFDDDDKRAAAAIGTERARSVRAITVRNGVAEGGRGTITVRNAGGEFNVPL